MKDSEKLPFDKVKAILDRLGPDFSDEQFDIALKNDPEALRQFMNVGLASEAQAADRLLRQWLDDDPLLARTIIETVIRMERASNERRSKE